MHVWQVPITVHFDHGTSKPELMEALELVSYLLTCFLHSVSKTVFISVKELLKSNHCYLKFHSKSNHFRDLILSW